MISILLGNGDGTFKPYIGGTPYRVMETTLWLLLDLNRDGKVDLVVASYYNPPGGVSVLLGNGNGTFAPAVSYPSPTVGAATNAVAVGDFNGDGKPDIAVTNYADITCRYSLSRGWCSRAYSELPCEHQSGRSRHWGLQWRRPAGYCVRSRLYTVGRGDRTDR